MKTKVGNLGGKPIVMCLPNEVNNNEILFELIDDFIVLKSLNSNGELTSMTKEVNKPVVSKIFNNVNITSDNIYGPSKWFKDSTYIFYIDKNIDFKIKSKNKNITNKAKLIAVGLNNKVYEISSKHFSDIIIKEV